MADIMLGQLLHRPTIDPISGDSPLPVQLSGRIVKFQIDTLVNAASAPASGGVTAGLNAQGESQLILLVSTDKQPWGLVGGTPWYPSAQYGSSKMFFPNMESRTATYTAVAPAPVLYLGIEYLGTTISAPADALAACIPPAPGVEIRFRNMSAETATVTVKALRIWR